MKKIVAFGSGNALAAICGVINSNPQSDMSVYRVSEEMSVVHNDKTTNFYLTLPDGKQIAKTLHRSPLLLEDLYWIKNADAYLVDGTWGSTNPKRQWKPAKIYREEERNLYHGRPSTGVRSARMEFMNVFVQELAKMYNKKVIVTESATLSRIKCNYIDSWYKNTGPRYYRMGLGHWTYGRTKWCKVDNSKPSRLHTMIEKTEKKNKIKLQNIEPHQWKNNKDGAVLIMPGLEYDPTSSVSVPEFIKTSVERVRLATNRKIIVKPHPLSKIVVKDLVKDVEVLPRETKLRTIVDRVYCGVLGESTSIFELINLGIPCITSKWNFGIKLNNTSIDRIEKIYYATPLEVLNWYKMVSHTEFDMSEFNSHLIIPYIKELLRD